MRVDHETLQGSIEKMVSVVLYIFKFYRGAEFSNHFGSNIIHFPFTVEDDKDANTMD